MKHLLVTNDFPPKIGGIQSLLWEWWRRLPPDSFSVLTSPYAGSAAFDAAQPFHVERTREQAQADVDATVAALRSAGCEASGEVVTQDPVQALEAEVGAGAEEVVIVTAPHAVEDTLHRDWASVARERLGVPVLHVYADSSWVG